MPESLRKKKFETGYFAARPAWEDTAKNRKDVAASRLQPPTLLFDNARWRSTTPASGRAAALGVAHTRRRRSPGAPNERILFTGDACVNGPLQFHG
jgi:hypothetical protein